ncbi:adenylate kinase family protein [Lutispora saccharofermentans]|uniref:ATP-binding protein n=1 Tax=Lutispora saccharofermentans TaxID=3024236 RepID=A0ABT1NFP8_9FIRM|nr:hypothetical protein [Lutispora saccharofermentans]MCQ1530075.1 hypothetical protein [Lutispora saccharofermentans]
MNSLQFIKKLYNGKNCYSDSLTEDEIALLHIPSGVERIVEEMVDTNRIIFLTGNPGDGKTYIIRALEAKLVQKDVYIEKDMNSVTDDKISDVINKIVECYHHNKSCIIAANEFPFFKLIRASKALAPELHNELINVKKNIIVYGYSTLQLRRICIIDLNERNLLDKDRSVIPPIVGKFVELLKDSTGVNSVLDYNVEALQSKLVIDQLMRLFNLVAMSGEHFAIRDILGTLAYAITACTVDDEDINGYYYDALFSGDNELMSFIAQFDPILLSKPSLDEQLWNGEKTDGWLMGAPNKWPRELTDESVEEATELFKSIKRKFYFENIFAKELSELQPVDYTDCERIFVSLGSSSNKRGILNMLINSMNRLFLSTDEEKERLRIWTSHSFDLSREAGAAVSTKYIDAADLDLVYPEPISWLKEMEFTPDHLVMKLKRDNNSPRLEIDVTLLRGLISIKNGYPASLLSGQYEQAISQFTQALAATSAARDYGDGELLIANRREGSRKKIYIEDNKYSFHDGGDF